MYRGYFFLYTCVCIESTQHNQAPDHTMVERENKTIKLKAQQSKHCRNITTQQKQLNDWA